MSQHTVVLLGSLYDYERNRTIDPVFLRDLKIFSLLPGEQLITVFEQLKQADSYDACKSIIKSEYGTDVSESVLRLVEFFTTAGTEGFIDALSELRTTSDVILKEFPESTWEEFLKRFRLVQEVIPIHCILNQIKYENLQTIVGNQFQNADIICDIRPVFDNTRNSVEDIVPVTTLKIRYLTQTEETKVLEVIVSERHIEELAEKVRMARQKWDVLRKIFAKDQQITNELSK